jgi:hypothetical protein
MKKQLLKPIFLIFILIPVFCNFCDAQIVYTDVIPDTIISSNNGVYRLDLNNDGIPDYNIIYSTTAITIACGGRPAPSPNVLISFTPLDSNEVGREPLYYYPLTVASNFLIDSVGYTWTNDANQVLTKKQWICHLNPPTHGFPGGYAWKINYSGVILGPVQVFHKQYLPLRLHVGSQRYYGWVQLSVDSGTTGITVKDYAYDSIPDQSIFSGDSCWFPVSINATGNTIFCFPDTLNHSTTFTISGGTNYLWSTGDTAATITVSPTHTTDYSVTVTNSSSGCQFYTNLPVRIEKIDTTVIINNLLLVVPNVLSDSYQWIDCSTMLPIPGATIDYYSGSSNGSYAVIITRNGCIDTSSCHTIFITGIDENSPSYRFSISSFNKKIEIKLNDLFVLNGNITVYNNSCQEVNKINIENKIMQIDMSDCSSGIYFVTVMMKDAIETKRVFLY